MMPMTDDELRTLLEKVIQRSPAEQTEIGFSSKKSGLTRFAGNQIHQNMSEADTCLILRVAVGNRIGSASINQLDDESIDWLVRNAVQNAENSKPNKFFGGFTRKMACQRIPAPIYFTETAEAGPAELGNKARALIQTVASHGYEAAGSVASGVYTSAVMTSEGQFVSQRDTKCSMLTVVNRAGQAGFGTGYSEFYGRDFNQIQPGEIAEDAYAISAMNDCPEPLEIGDYRVILSPASVGLLMFYLSWMSFHAGVIETKQSFLSERMEERVLDPSLSILDDALDGRNYGKPFDWEGFPKQRVDLIQNGRAMDVVYDSISAKRAGRMSTGHALCHARDRYYSSPMTENLVIGTGTSNLDEMIQSTERGLFINHLWYVREQNFKNASVTGMTRDGTFLVENGKITRALRNLRFSVSLNNLFNNIDLIGDKLSLSKMPIGNILAPAMKLNRFPITGSSSY